MTTYDIVHTSVVVQLGVRAVLGCA